MPHASNLWLSLSKNKPPCFRQFIQNEIQSRRTISLFVPDDVPNFFVLPRGIRAGSRFKINLNGKTILR